MTALNSMNSANNKASFPALQPQRITLNNMSKIDEDLEGLTTTKEAAGYGDYDNIPPKDLLDEAKISDEAAVFGDETKNNAPLRTSMQMDKMINDHILQRTALENMMLTSDTDAGAKTLNNYDINKGNFAKQDEKEEGIKEEGNKNIFANIKNRLDQLSDNAEYNIGKGGDLLEPIPVPIGGTQVPGREGVSSVAGIFKQSPISDSNIDGSFTPGDVNDVDDNALSKWSSQGDDLGTINGLNGYDTAGNRGGGPMSGGYGGGGEGVGGGGSNSMLTPPSASGRPHKLVNNSFIIPNMNEARIDGLNMQQNALKNRTKCPNCRTKVGNANSTRQQHHPLLNRNETTTPSNVSKVDNDTTGTNLNGTEDGNHTKSFNDEIDFLANVIMNDIDRVKLKTRDKTDNTANSSEQTVVVGNITAKNSQDCIKLVPMNKTTLPYECVVDIVKSKNDTQEEKCSDGLIKKKDTGCHSDFRKASDVDSTQTSSNDTAINGTSLLVSINVSDDDEGAPADNQKTVNETVKLLVPDDKPPIEHTHGTKSKQIVRDDASKRHNLTATSEEDDVQASANATNLSGAKTNSLIAKINHTLSLDELISINPDKDDISPADIAKELEIIEMSFIKNPSLHHRHRASSSSSSRFRDVDGGVDKREGGGRFNRMNDMLKQNLMQRVALERAMMNNNISSIQHAALEHGMLDHHIIPDLSILTENDINVAGRDSIHEDEEEDRYSQFQDKIDQLLDQVRSSAFSRKGKIAVNVHVPKNGTRVNFRIHGPPPVRGKKHDPSQVKVTYAGGGEGKLTLRGKDGKVKKKPFKLSKPAAASRKKGTGEKSDFSFGIAVNEAKLRGPPSMPLQTSRKEYEGDLNEEAKKKEEIINKGLERTNDIINLLSDEGEEQAPAYARNKIKNFTYAKDSEGSGGGERRENKSITKEEKLRNSLHAAFSDYIGELRKEVTDKKIEKKVYSYLNLGNTLEGKSDWELDEAKNERDKLMNETQKNLQATQRNLDRIHDNMRYAHKNINSTETNMVGSEETIKETVESSLKSNAHPIESAAKSEVKAADAKTDVAEKSIDDPATTKPTRNSSEATGGNKKVNADAKLAESKEEKYTPVVTLDTGDEKMKQNDSIRKTPGYQTDGKENTTMKSSINSYKPVNSTKNTTGINSDKAADKNNSVDASPLLKPNVLKSKYHVYTNTTDTGSSSTSTPIFPDTKQSFAVMNNRPHVVSVDINPDSLEAAGKRSKPFNSSKALLDILDLNEALTSIIKVVRKSGKNFTPNKMHLIKNILRSMNHFYSEIEQENNAENNARTLDNNNNNTQNNNNSQHENETKVNVQEDVKPRNRTNIEIRGILKSSILNGKRIDGGGASPIQGSALKFDQMDRMIQNHLLQRAALENEMSSGNIIPDVTTLNDYDLNMKGPGAQQRSDFQEQPNKIQEKLDYLLDHALYPMTQRKGDIEANKKEKEGVNEHKPRVFFINHNATKRTLDSIMKLNNKILKDISKPADKKSDITKDFNNFTNKLTNSFHMSEKMKAMKSNVASTFLNGRKTLQSKMAFGKKTMQNMLKASEKRDETNQMMNSHILELLGRAKSHIPDLQKNASGVQHGGKGLNASKRNEFVKEVMSQMTNLYDEMKTLINDDDKKPAAAANSKQMAGKVNESSNSNIDTIEAMQAFKNESLSKSQYGAAPQQNQTDVSDKRSEDSVSVTSQQDKDDKGGLNFHVNINFTGKKRNTVSKVERGGRSNVSKKSAIDPDLLGIRPEQILT